MCRFVWGGGCILHYCFLLLTNAIAVYHAFPRYAVAPQTLVHVTAGLPILHPVICGCGDHQHNIPNASTEQSTSHKAVHGAPVGDNEAFSCINSIFVCLVANTTNSDF